MPETLITPLSRWILAFAQTELVSLASRRGDLDGALALAADVIDTWYRAGDWANQWLTLRHVAGVTRPPEARPEICTVRDLLEDAALTSGLAGGEQDGLRFTTRCEAPDPVRIDRRLTLPAVERVIGGDRLAHRGEPARGPLDLPIQELYAATAVMNARGVVAVDY